MKRLVLMFDGTWDTPETETNVWRLCESLSKQDAQGIEQRACYLKGVGTSWHGKLAGGAFGYGLSEIICNYTDGDEIFVFGFSRGAYSARSLVGLIRKCGLLKLPTKELVEAAYALYRKRDDNVDGPEPKEFRDRFSHTPRIRFVGVWDSVGSLGVPLTGLRIAPFRDYYRFHDTSLSKIVDYTYYALAIDEHREDYIPALWTEIKPENQEVEQRWFIGAHRNIGGGYKGDSLFMLPLAWLQLKAQAAGLALQVPVILRGDEWRTAPRDSFKEFIYGIYSLAKFGKRYYRTVRKTVCESIDPSIWQRTDAVDMVYALPT